MKSNPGFFVEKPMSIFHFKLSYKPALERSMLEIAEIGKVWASLDKFESVTNDSVK